VLHGLQQSYCVTVFSLFRYPKMFDKNTPNFYIDCWDQYVIKPLILLFKNTVRWNEVIYC
jgi:hypothetical protein